jgi:hypothetical protein
MTCSHGCRGIRTPIDLDVVTILFFRHLCWRIRLSPSAPRKYAHTRRMGADMMVEAKQGGGRDAPM